LALIDELEDGTEVAIDTNSIIYFVEQDDKYFPIVQPLFVKIANGLVRPHLSVITLMEVLVRPLRDGLEGLAANYRQTLSPDGRFVLHSFNPQIAERAAFIRAQTNLRTPDAIIAASALEANCTHLVTNDPVFRRVNGLKVLVLGDYALL
jgi:predicted nucleic acid-binding protein